MKGKPILYIDMDGVIVDFDSGISKLSEKDKSKYIGKYDEKHGIFGLMEPMPGAISAVEHLSKYFDVYILSTAPWNNHSAWSDKIKWIKKHFGHSEDSLLFKKLILSSHKHLNHGDCLIDDRLKNGADKFRGKFIHFGTEQYPNWQIIVDYLISNVAQFTEELN